MTSIFFVCTVGNDVTPGGTVGSHLVLLLGVLSSSSSPKGSVNSDAYASHRRFPIFSVNQNQNQDFFPPVIDIVWFDLIGQTISVLLSLLDSANTVMDIPLANAPSRVRPLYMALLGVPFLPARAQSGTGNWPSTTLSN